MKENHEKLDDLLDEFVNILYVLPKDKKKQKELFSKLEILMKEMIVISKQIGGILQEHVFILHEQLQAIMDHPDKKNVLVEDCLKVKNDLWLL